MNWQAIATGALLALATAGAAEQKPNVLFIAVDDLRPELNCYGKTEVKSPNMDRLATEGVLFQRAYCNLPQCKASRASLLTGFRPESIGKAGQVNGAVLAKAVTLPRLFRKNGYTTVSMGKVYHMHDDDPDGWVRKYADTLGEKDGWFSGYQLQENRDLVKNYQRSKPNASPITEITDTPDEMTPDGIIARHAIEELRNFKKSGEPFFLATGFYRPHLPLTAPKKYWDMYDRSQIPLPADFRQPDDGIPRWDWDEVRRFGDCPKKGPMPEDKAREIIQGYHASVTFVDAQIGKVLDELHTLGLDKNTIVILFGDNGWNLGDHGRWSKMTSYEASARVAMMIKVPWISTHGETSALTELVDMYPTLCELCRLSPPDYLEGTSMVPLLSDPARPWKTAVFGCLYDANRTIRTDRYRLIEHPAGQLELYDHVTDPAEDHNLAADPELAGTLKELQTAMQAGWREAAKPRSAPVGPKQNDKTGS